jgi:hypothetical protein
MNSATRFLAAYRLTGNVSRAAEAACISRDLHYRRMRKDDPAYHAAFAEAEAGAIGLLEDEARTGAVEGREHAFFQHSSAPSKTSFSDESSPCRTAAMNSAMPSTTRFFPLRSMNRISIWFSILKNHNDAVRPEQDSPGPASTPESTESLAQAYLRLTRLPQ